jgi:hypothetical protein
VKAAFLELNKLIPQNFQTQILFWQREIIAIIRAPQMLQNRCANSHKLLFMNIGIDVFFQSAFGTV